MNLFPLSVSPRQSSEELADIHLLPSFEFGIRILNALIHRTHSDKITEVKLPDGGINYSVRGIELLPPLWKNWRGRENSTAKWVDWAQAHHRNFWWIYTYLWFLTKERTTRFDVPQHEHFKLMSKWKMEGLFAMLPTDMIDAKGINPNVSAPQTWPVTYEVEPFISFDHGIHWAYQELYKTLLRTARCKWTRRNIPMQFKPTAIVVV